MTQDDELLPLGAFSPSNENDRNVKNISWTFVVVCEHSGKELIITLKNNQT